MTLLSSASRFHDGPVGRIPRWRLRLLPVAFVLLILGQPARAAEAPPSWEQLTPAQQHILAPLQSDWREFDRDRKKKWLDIAARYPAMSPEQQQRLQRRMNEWAHLSPEKRRLAREAFLSTGKAPLHTRRAAWEAYQKLPEAERQRLKEEARHPKPKPGQVGKYLQEKQKRVHELPAHPTKPRAAASAAKPVAAASAAASARAPAAPGSGTASGAAR